MWDMSARTVYCCPTCQPLISADPGDKKLPAGGRSSSAIAAAAGLSPARQAALSAAKVAQIFRSHCAPDDPSGTELVLSKMTVVELKVGAQVLDDVYLSKFCTLVCLFLASITALP